MKSGLREEAIEPDEGNQGPEARPQHLRRREWRSTHQSRQGIHYFVCLFNVDVSCRRW